MLTISKHSTQIAPLPPQYVHELSRNLGLKSKSSGKGDSRCITVTKNMDTGVVQRAVIPDLNVGGKQAESLLLEWGRKHGGGTGLAPKVRRGGGRVGGYGVLYFCLCLLPFA